MRVSYPTLPRATTQSLSLSLLLCLTTLFQYACASPTRTVALYKRQDATATPSSPPTITLDGATVTGVNQGNVSRFLGIPFAPQPARFDLPSAIPSYNGSINATAYGPKCPQQNVTFPLGLSDIPDIITHILEVQQPQEGELQQQQNGTQNGTQSGSGSQPTDESEDCLSISVMRPANVSVDEKLPVVVWIYGGGFERGSVDVYDDQAMRIMNRSIELGQPVVYAAMNYRVSAWGFLASEEVRQAGIGNVGLVDQRLALEWVHKYISAFGGDPTKVTLWGQSAGAISASLQMLAYGGNITDANTSSSLFHGAFLQSGSPIPAGNITGGQIYYDFLVNQTNCSLANDTLSCLRDLPLDQFRAAVDMTPNYFSYQGLALAWSPRADGVFLQDNPQRLLQQGKVSPVPLVSGDVDDEGTLFSLASRNVTSDEQFREYISNVFVPYANETELQPLWELYPQDPSDGSPFNTSNRNDITPQYKRIAAFQGDVVFQAPRRFFLEHMEGKAKMWSYLSLRDKYTPVVGSYHSSDLETHILDDYLLRFVYYLDPNLESPKTSWPEYNTTNPQLLTFPIFSFSDLEITPDTYREEPMRYLMNLSLAHPL